MWQAGRDRAAGDARRRAGCRCALAGALCLAMALALAAAGTGCRSNDYLQIRRVPRNPLESQLQLLSRKGPQPSERTANLIRRYDLKPGGRDYTYALEQLQNEIAAEPRSEKVYAYAELAYIGGWRAQSEGDDDDALQYYGASVAHAYTYLFDPRFNYERNPYDPQFRGACDLYNGALEAALRIVNRQGKLRPGALQRIKVGDEEFGLNVVLRGPWHDDEFESLEFVSEYEVSGLSNRHYSYGLGVPMIAVRRKHANEAAYEEYYPPGLSFPVTAFLRVRPGGPGEPARVCTVELHDTLAARAVRVANNYLVPLETDLSTPLAYVLQQDDFQERNSIATAGLLRPGTTRQAQGMYMLEPYDPQKIPVIMVHGLWSSPLTWMEMFNDLRSFPELRERYQFWFYLYPTGQPFWISAEQLRSDLARVRRTLDPHARNPVLTQMVLVGHSMGGLVSRMQIIDSEDRFWKIVSEEPLEQVITDPEERRQIANVFFFRPNPCVRRVITIGTPYHGSNFSNDTTRWLGRKFIRLPQMLVRAQQLLQQSDAVRSRELMSYTTSIDSLAADSPVLPVLRQAPRAPWVRVHNIVGVVPDEGIVGALAGESDGIVDYASAHVEDADSELVVVASHTEVHRHPRSILEVRQILLDHLRELHCSQLPAGPPTPQLPPPGHTRPMAPR